MVYAANGALVTPGHAIGARFAFPQRAGEAEAYAGWLERNGLGPVHRPREVNEGEGDFLVVGDQILAGTGFRTSPAAHAEVAAVTGMSVVSLELVDPRFYHLDTALAVLDDDTVAYYPGAFSVTSQATLATLFPDAIIATEDRRRGARPQRRLRRPARRAHRRGDRARRPRWPRGASSPYRSTCPSCSRAVAA